VNLILHPILRDLQKSFGFLKIIRFARLTWLEQHVDKDQRGELAE
jgi:hypothetical protein